MTINEQLVSLREALQVWAELHGGVAEIVARPSELVRMLSLKPGGVRAVLLFDVETKRGDYEETGRVDRKFLCIITVPAGLKISRSDALTEGAGGGAPFYDVIEEAREIIRHKQVEAAEDIDETLTDYQRMGRFELQGALTDDIQIEFSLATQLPQDTEDSEA